MQPLLHLLNPCNVNGLSFKELLNLNLKNRYISLKEAIQNIKPIWLQHKLVVKWQSLTTNCSLYLRISGLAIEDPVSTAAQSYEISMKAVDKLVHCIKKKILNVEDHTQHLKKTLYEYIREMIDKDRSDQLISLLPQKQKRTTYKENCRWWSKPLLACYSYICRSIWSFANAVTWRDSFEVCSWNYFTCSKLWWTNGCVSCSELYKRCTW